MSWVRAIGGTLNPAKSVHMTFCKAVPPPPSSPDFFMDGVVVPKSYAPRDVGVILDSRLSYSAHIEKVLYIHADFGNVLFCSPTLYMAKYLSPDRDSS